MQQPARFLAFACALGAAGMLCASGVAAAATGPCYVKASSQTDLNRCADADARASPRRVAAAYALLKKHVFGAELRGVVADQRAWNAYVTANCRSASNVELPDSGSIAPMNNLQCVTERNKQLVAYLHWRAESPEQQQRQPMP